MRETSLTEPSVTGPEPCGGATAAPPAPVASASGTRTSTRAPLPGMYRPTACGRFRSPPAVGWSAPEPATASGIKRRVAAGKPVYFTRNRVPVSRPGDRASKAEAKPSVTRVEAKAVPAAKRLGRSKVSGAGDPTQVIVVLDMLESMPACE